MTRRAHGSTPPNPSSPILRKLVKSVPRLIAASEGDVDGWVGEVMMNRAKERILGPLRRKPDCRCRPAVGPAQSAAVHPTRERHEPKADVEIHRASRRARLR